MRIPSDVSLERYIRYLIKNGKIEVFYHTDDWKEVKQEVLEELHNECQECLKQGRYTKADCVHHHNHVKARPDLALSKYYIDHEGNKHRQLIPLCDACHNMAHPEKGFGKQKNEKFINVEKW